jgi:cyclin-dependent kinase
VLFRLGEAAGAGLENKQHLLWLSLSPHPLPKAMAMVEETIEELERRFDMQYLILEKTPVGEGTYGKVYKARCTRSAQAVAMKKMKLDAEEEGVPSTAIREIALLKELSHDNVVKLLDVFCSTTKMILVFEFVENDLKKYMKAYGKPLPPNTIKGLTFQLCCGVEFCHANRILHRDIKPQNLLIDHQLRLKIADFGLARAYTVPVPKYTHEVVTVWYRAPEILLGSALYSVPVDMWSVGCVFGELATGGPLFGGDSEIDTIFKVFQKLGTPVAEQWPEVVDLPEFKPTFPKWAPRGWDNIRNTKEQVGSEGIDLLERFLAYDPKRRLSARKALQHPYFVDAARLRPPIEG